MDLKVKSNKVEATGRRKAPKRELTAAPKTKAYKIFKAGNVSEALDKLSGYPFARIGAGCRIGVDEWARKDFEYENYSIKEGIIRVTKN